MKVYHGSNQDISEIDLQDKYLDQQQTKLEPTHHEIANLLIDERISDMTQYLMEDYGYTLEKALDCVYRSETIKLLQKENAELYVQSSAYVYDMLIKELSLYHKSETISPHMVAED